MPSVGLGFKLASQCQILPWSRERVAASASFLLGFPREAPLAPGEATCLESRTSILCLQKMKTCHSWELATSGSCRRSSSPHPKKFCKHGINQKLRQKEAEKPTSYQLIEFPPMPQDRTACPFKGKCLGEGILELVSQRGTILQEAWHTASLLSSNYWN